MTREGSKICLLLAAGGILTLALASSHARVDHVVEPMTSAATTFPQGALLNLGHATNHYYLYYHFRRGSLNRQQR